MLGSDDWQLWIRIAASGAATAVVERPLATYRYRPGSGSRDRNGACLLHPASERVLEKALGELSLAPKARRAGLKSLALHRRRARFDEARAALLEGDTEAALRLARAGLQAQPKLKGALIVAALRLAPGLLRGVHGSKRRLRQATRSALARLGSRPASELSARG